MLSLGRRSSRRGLLLTLIIVVILAIVSSTVSTTAASAHAARSEGNAGNRHASLSSAAVPSVVTGSNIVSANSGKCLDVANFGHSNLDNVQQWACHNPATQNQLWNPIFISGATWTDPATGQTFPLEFIQEEGTNECLEAFNHGITNGTNVDIYACGSGVTGHENQVWIVDFSGTHLWNYGATLFGNDTPVALDVVCTASTNFGTNNGANVQLWQADSTSSCHGNNQIWSF